MITALGFPVVRTGEHDARSQGKGRKLRVGRQILWGLGNEPAPAPSWIEKSRIKFGLLWGCSKSWEHCRRRGGRWVCGSPGCCVCVCMCGTRAARLLTILYASHWSERFGRIRPTLTLHHRSKRDGLWVRL